LAVAAIGLVHMIAGGLCGRFYARMQSLSGKRIPGYQNICSIPRGIDLVAHYRVATDAAGNFDFAVARNLNDVKLSRVFSGTSTVNVPALFCRPRIVSIEDGMLVKKLTGQVDWSKFCFGSSALTWRQRWVYSDAGEIVWPDAIDELRAHTQHEGTAMIRRLSAA